MEKKQLFSLRKLSVGIASVSLGTLVLLGGGQTVSAETQDLTQKTQEAYNTINNLPSLTDAQKDAYNQQILELSGQNNSNFDAILAEAQTNNTQAAQNINTASQDAYNTINNLPSLTDAQKDAYNQQILEAAGANNTDFNQILNDAQATNTQAAQDINQASQEAYNTINNLPSLTDAQKDAYNQRILEVAGANSTDFAAILDEAQKVNDQAAQDINQASLEAYNTINNLPHLTDAQKDAYNQRILEVAGANSTDFAAILDEAKALDAKQAPAEKDKAEDKEKQDDTSKEEAKPEDNKSEQKEQPKKDVEKVIKKATDEKATLKDRTQSAHNAVKKLTNLSQKQKDAYNTQIDKSAKEDKGAQFEAILNKAKAEDAKAAKTAEAKELPATGESDEVLFGLLSGSLFASAGTLFLLNARRKENK